MCAKKYVKVDSNQGHIVLMRAELPLHHARTLALCVVAAICPFVLICLVCLPLCFHPRVTITPGVLRVVWLIHSSSTLPAHTVSLLTKTHFSCSRQLKCLRPLQCQLYLHDLHIHLLEVW